MTSPLPSRATLAAAVVAVALTAAACSSGGASGAASSGATTSGRGSTATGSPVGASVVAAGQPFGPGCAALPTAGPGSSAVVAAVPVATAATVEPRLTALVRAITAAHLRESLDGEQDVTVFAPVDAAFQALPPDRFQALLADVPRLTAVLTHHVVQGRLGPGSLAGSHTTLDNDQLVVEGAGDRFTVAGAQTLSGKPANVVCGNVQTANATVYLIDQVLKPQAGG